MQVEPDPMTLMSEPLVPEWDPRELPEVVKDGKGKGVSWYTPTFLITGTSGSGKSAIAEAILKALADRYPRVYWITGGDRTNAENWLPNNHVIFLSAGYEGKVPFQDKHHLVMNEDMVAGLIQGLIQVNKDLMALPPRKRNVDNRVFIVFDDFTHLDLFGYRRTKSPIGQLGITLTTTTATDLGISTMFLTHDLTTIQPKIRDQCKINIYLCPSNHALNMVETACNFRVGSKRDFCEFVNKICHGHTAAVFDRGEVIKQAQRPNPGWYSFNSQDFHFVGPILGGKELPVLLGCKEMWKKDPRYRKTYPYPARYIVK